MTWVEWCYYSEGLYRAKSKQFEHTRAISWMIYKSNSDPNTAEKDMMSWWSLPTDVRVQKKIVKAPRLSKKKQEEFFKNMR